MIFAKLSADQTTAVELASQLNIVWDANNFCTVEALVKDGWDTRFGVVPVTEIAAPAIDSATQTVQRDGLEKVVGVWTYKWLVVAIPPLQIAANLVAAKLDKNAQINAWRAQANQTSFTHLGKTVACDALSRSDIDAVAGTIALNGAYPAGFPGAWKATDNTYLLLPDLASFRAMYSSMTLQGTTNFGKSQTLKTTLGAATTLAQVNAIVWG